MFDIPPKELELNEDGLFFQEIWNERPHKSEISGQDLNFNFGPPMFFVFSHLHSKGSSPKLRHNKENIVLMTMYEHNLWEFHRHKLRGLPKWDWVFKRFENLKAYA